MAKKTEEATSAPEITAPEITAVAPEPINPLPEDIVRLKLKSLVVRAGTKKPDALRPMYGGKVYELPVGEKGILVSRAFATHLLRKSRSWSMKADLEVSETS